MARKSKFNRADAVEKVMYAMWENGYQSSSVKSLSEMLGITRSSFYHAFGSRLSLFKEVIVLYESRLALFTLLSTKKGECICYQFTRYFEQLCRLRSQDIQHKGCLSINSMVELCHHWEEIRPQEYEAIAAQSNLYSNSISDNSDLMSNSPSEGAMLAIYMRDKFELTNESIEKLLSWAKEQDEISSEANVASLALAVNNLNIGINTMSRIVHEEYRLWEAAKTTLIGLGLYAEN